MTHAEVYADGISHITVGGGIVRVDLVSLSRTERDANNNPKSTFRQRLIFSGEGFANSVEAMQKALEGMVATGVIRRRRPNAEPAPPPVAEQPRPGKKRQQRQTLIRAELLLRAEPDELAAERSRQTDKAAKTDRAKATATGWSLVLPPPPQEGESPKAHWNALARPV